MFGSSLPLVVCRRAHVLFMLFVFVCDSVEKCKQVGALSELPRDG